MGVKPVQGCIRMLNKNITRNAHRASIRERRRQAMIMAAAITSIIRSHTLITAAV